ncbi:hypothetical protein [Lactobacillus johnsonii]|uniref:hypothetical protein n=1 Tax=Lactobacillus johnsonii TaxID=33959 RepID=UPI001FB5664B|nr:hypothetical protein [Lactobacillus johnsonii]UOC05454.1 hypothetical protein LC811_06370 [Lactobacillus johnsonii]
MLKGKNLVIAVLLVLVCVLGFSNIQNSKDIDSLTSQLQATRKVELRGKRVASKCMAKLRRLEERAQAKQEENDKKDAKIKKMKKQLDECKTETRDSISTKTGKHETIKLTPAQAKEFDETGEIADSELDD